MEHSNEFLYDRIIHCLQSVLNSSKKIHFPTRMSSKSGFYPLEGSAPVRVGVEKTWSSRVRMGVTRYDSGEIEGSRSDFEFGLG